jgi:hypothetical protein
VKKQGLTTQMEFHLAALLLGQAWDAVINLSLSLPSVDEGPRAAEIQDTLAVALGGIEMAGRQLDLGGHIGRDPDAMQRPLAEQLDAVVRFVAQERTS